DLELRSEDELRALAPGRVRERDDDRRPADASGLGGLGETRPADAARLAEHRVDPGEELGGMERLREVVRRAAREAADLVEHVAAGRQEDHRDVGGGAVAVYLEAH